MSCASQEKRDDIPAQVEYSSSAEELDEEPDILTEYSDELTLVENELEPKGHELVQSQNCIDNEDQIFETEQDIEPQEIEIRSDQGDLIEEAAEQKHKPATNIPPLRLLNIAPKPEKIPITVKSVAGQPLILVPGPAGAQTIKLINAQGQEINLANYPLNRPVAIKQLGRTAITPNTFIQKSQPKQIFMKKIITSTAGLNSVNKPLGFDQAGHQFVVVHKSADQAQQIKVVQSGFGANFSAPSTVQSKTLTLQDAQDMGLLGNAKIIQNEAEMPTKRTVLINRTHTKTLKMVNQDSSMQTLNNPTNIKPVSLGQGKSHSKIMPATITTIASVKGPQKIIFKSCGENQSLPSGQLIQFSGSQGIVNGQIHQVNVPGKGVQYIKFVTATSAESTNPIASFANTVKNTSTVNVVPEIKMHKVAIPSVKQIVNQTKQILTTGVPRPLAPITSPSPEESPSSPTASATETVTDSTGNTNGIRPRKPCNCTKSQCLKLYCDCFANGEFCYLCNCMNCFNNLGNEDTRNLAIKACLERNPNAFRPKIGKAKNTTGDVSRKHTKGCNCKRSGCLKNYCECYEAKIACSGNCKCIACRNIEDAVDKKTLEVSSSMHRISDEELVQTVYRKIMPNVKHIDLSSPGRLKKPNSRKQPITYIIDEVIEATCQCLLTISDEADLRMEDPELTKRQIIEEFGGCLNEIINCSLNRSIS